MARTLPSAKDLGVVQVQPSLGVASYRGATGEEGAAARGLVAAGGSFVAVSEHLQRAQDEFDLTQAEDRFNQYQEKLNQIATDPEKGWKTASGENVLKPEFAKKYADRFEEERKRLLDTLGTQNAKERFNRLAASASMRHRAALYEHSAKERVQYDTKVYEDSIKTAKANAWRAHGDDALFEAELGRVRALTERFARNWFVGADETSIKLAVQQAESGMWAHRVEAALAAGDAPLAKELMGKASGVLTTDDKAKLDAKVKPILRVTKAVSAVDEVFGKLVSRDLNAPYPAVQVDAELRRMFADDPEMLSHARREADYRRRGLDDAQKENEKANIGGVMQSLFEKNRPLSEVMKTPEYQALGGDTKAKVVLQYESVAASREAKNNAREGRALTAMHRAALEQERAGKRAVAQFMLNPEVVTKMDDNAIREFALTAGPEAALDLKQFRDRLDKPEKVIAARMDAQTFKGIISDYGYKPELLTARPKGDNERQQQDELNTIYREVNQRIQAKAQELKRQPTQEEKEQIMRDALTQKVKIDNGWFRSDREVPTIAIPATGERGTDMRARASVPITEIPPESLTATYEFIRRNRPGFERKTDKQITDSLKPQIERAAALARMGASAEEVKAVLMGAK